jgi:magnesium transporter
MPFKTYSLGLDGQLRRGLSEEEVREAFQSKKGLLWVDISQTTEEDSAFLQRTFNFHHLALEDCLSPRLHPPKIDDFDDYLFIIVHGVNYMAESDIVETTELAIFLGPHFVVSNHNLPLYSVESVRRLVESSGRPMQRGADFLVYALVDALVDNVLPTVDKMSEVADGIEEEVIRHPQQSSLESIMKLKRSALHIHRIMAPQRETMNRLSRGEFPLIKAEAQVFYRDIYDHVLRIEYLTQDLRERADSTLTTYLASVANRQNEVMKTLSVVATIVLPLSLLAGIYGMNFENMPELGTSWAYFSVLGFMGVVILGGIGWFWARQWITWGRRQAKRIRLFAVEPEKIIGHLPHLAKR